ncbi:phage integrase family protein [Cupriavidus yeoncheonensis]
MWERYLPDAGDYADGHAVHRMTGFVRRELMAAAARAGHFGRAHLLRLNLAPAADGGALPSLETFAATHGLDGFGEAEQQALYDDHYRADLDVQRRRTCLLRRQLLAIYSLEAQLCTPVALGDGCEAWFVDTLAQRLADAGLGTLGALHARMTASPDWWKPLRGIGAGKAQAIRQFMQAHASTLGPLPDWEAGAAPDTGADAPDLPAVVSTLVPLDRLVVPAALTGASGRHRAPQETCLLHATNDLEAIRAWIAAKAPPTTPDHAGRLTYTQLCYRKEAERFALWCVVENQTALSSVGIEDCTRYRDFLLAPPAHWCGPRSIGRWQVGWRPLEGPLSARSCAYALSVLNNLFNFLVKQGYLVGNPWAAVQAPGVVGAGLDTGRALTAALWHVVGRVLDGLPVTLATLRLRVALGLLRQTGIRLAELVQATTGRLEWLALAQPPLAPDEGWWLTVTGKGGRIRRVPVTDDWVNALGDYLVARGLSPDPGLAGDIPLIGSAAEGAPATAGISRNVFHKQVKRFFERCARELDATDPRGAARLRAASTHWLRHTAISEALARGAPVEIVQANAGHVSLATTTRYVQVQDARRARAMRGVWESH